MKRLSLAASFAALIALGFVAIVPAAHAELHLDITRGTITPLPIAIPNFAGVDEGQQVGHNITQVITNDLASSGLFKPLDPRAFIDKEAATRNPPDYSDWRVLNAQALVTGDVQLQPDGKLQVEFRLWDVLAQQQLTGLRYTGDEQNWRRIAHIISDAIYKRITGEEGYFDTRIVYVAETGPLDHRIKRLAIMDQDGANNRYLTSGRALVMTPRFSPTAHEITYLSYAGGHPRVYLLNIDTGQREVLGDFHGMTFAPRFSPDGNKVIMSIADSNGASNIYTLDLKTHHSVRLTNDSAIDTSPCYSPDGTRIVFTSDRGGSQQLYVMNADGSGVHRITFGAGTYGTPAWSPRGDLIAFTKIEGGRFYIGVMRPDGSGERLLANGFLVEGPTWAPNGRVLMYYKRTRIESRGHGGESHLYSIDITGYNEREIVTPTDATDPAWSPLIP
ncbi:MAG: Tol-Pal system beta propeller repeat protein TolB [Stellaceae bacterium]